MQYHDDGFGQLDLLEREVYWTGFKGENKARWRKMMTVLDLESAGAGVVEASHVRCACGKATGRTVRVHDPVLHGHSCGLAAIARCQRQARAV